MSDTSTAQLSERNVQVLQLHAKGFSDKEVAGYLGVVEKTVSYHLNYMQRRLGYRTRTHLVHFALKNGLVEFIV